MTDLQVRSTLALGEALENSSCEEWCRGTPMGRARCNADESASRVSAKARMCNAIARQAGSQLSIKAVFAQGLGRPLQPPFPLYSCFAFSFPAKTSKPYYCSARSQPYAYSHPFPMHLHSDFSSFTFHQKIVQVEMSLKRAIIRMLKEM